MPLRAHAGLLRMRIAEVSEEMRRLRRLKADLVKMIDRADDCTEPRQVLLSLLLRGDLLTDCSRTPSKSQ